MNARSLPAGWVAADGPAPGRIDVLIVDDQPLMRDSLRRLVEELRPGAVVGEAGGLQESTCLLDISGGCELALVDLDLVDADAFELIRRLHDAHPAMRVAAMSTLPDESALLRAIALGARGYFSKRQPVREVRDALAMFLSGEMVVAVSRQPAPAGLVNGHGPARAAPARPRSLQSLGLTPRQQQLLPHLAAGRPDKVIARDLGLSIDTVKDHVSAIKRALGVRTRAELAGVLAELDLGQPDPSRDA